MTHEQIEVTLGLTAMVAVGGLLIYHVTANRPRMLAVEPVEVPANTAPAVTAPSAPLYLTYNVPPVQSGRVELIPTDVDNTLASTVNSFKKGVA